MDEAAESTTQKLSQNSLLAQAGCPDRYEIKGLIGQGGMGMVFHAFDRELNRDVAIKILYYAGSENADSQERFLREAKALALLCHPNIVQIFSSGLNSQGHPFYVMEYLEGTPLAVEIRQSVLNEQEFLELCKQVLSGLHHAHQHKIAHRDLKPGNIMHCREKDGSSVYKIIDFGIARIEPNPGESIKTLTSTDSILGSPLYISPEQCRGERGDYLSDIYAMGCLMHECIAGNPPFFGETSFETMYKHMSEQAPRLDEKTSSAASTRLAELIQKCLAKNRDERPQSAEELSRSITEIFESADCGIDLFLQKKTRTKRKSGTWFLARNLLLIAFFLASTILLALYIHNKNMEGAGKSIRYSANPDKIVERNVIRLKSRKLESQKAKLNDSGKISVYLKNLVALGREQMKSTRLESIMDAELTFTEGIDFCKKTKDCPSKFLPLCYSLRAKSRYLQNKLSDSEKDFAVAISSIKESKMSAACLRDVYLERCPLRVRQRDFVALRKEYDWVIAFFLDNPSSLNFIPALDTEGDNRLRMANNILIEIRSTEAKSEEEKIELARICNYIASTFPKVEKSCTGFFDVRLKSEARKALKYSEVLLEKVPGQEKLKAQTEELLIELNQ